MVNIRPGVMSLPMLYNDQSLASFFPYLYQLFI